MIDDEKPKHMKTEPTGGLILSKRTSTLSLASLRSGKNQAQTETIGDMLRIAKSFDLNRKYTLIRQL